MPIRQMQQFADLRRQGNPTIPQRRELLDLHQQLLQKQLEELNRNLSIIQEKIQLYKELEVNHDRSWRSKSRQSKV